MLDVKNLNVFYGNIQALKDVSIKVNRGEIVAFIGANGAGKTTLLNAIAQIVKKSSGEIVLDNEDITVLPPHKVLLKRIALVPEGRQVFSNLTVLENLEMGAFIIKSKKVQRERLKEMFTLFPRLKERSKQIAGTLSGGEQQLLAIARALMSDPDIILLDEPSMGLSPILVNDIFEIIKSINKMNKTVLLVEQNAKMALSIANYAYVIENGRIVLEDKAINLIKNESVKKAYLGG